MDEDFTLKIYGLVQNSLNLKLNDIKALPKVGLTFDFRCVEGWEIKDTQWQGVRVRDLLELSKPLKSAKYAIFKSGDYTITLSLERIMKGDVVLAYEYMGKQLTKERGGPIRLVFPSQYCYESVKWLEEIEITDIYKEGTGKRIALYRIGKADV
ncbi:MAG: molybdopterin-dependent oxidoreductase [Thermofilaceae archaeon]